MTPQVPPRTEPDEPIFGVCGHDGTSIRCRVCGAVDEIDSDEMPSMAGYGEDTYTKCTRCGSVETTDPIFGWRAKPATWPPHPEHDQSSRLCSPSHRRLSLKELFREHLLLHRRHQP